MSRVVRFLFRRVADVRDARYRAPHGGELRPRYLIEVAADAGEQLVSARPAAAWRGTRNTVPSRAATEGSLASGRGLLVEGEAPRAPRTQQVSRWLTGPRGSRAAEAVRVP
jgi:hypothetical protein